LVALAQVTLALSFHADCFRDDLIGFERGVIDAISLVTPATVVQWHQGPEHGG
jgi:hypothetical protein